jgi:FtsH-binding integral membrane protein
VLSFMGAVAALLTDLGLELMSAAMVFFVCALAALVGGLLLRRKASAS